MRSTRRRLIALLSMIGALVLISAYLMYPSPRLNPSDIPDASGFSSGDIILLSSETCRGLLVRIAEFGDDYAHVGIADVDEEGVWIIHADPEADSVIKEKLSSYVCHNEVSRMMLLEVDSSFGEKAVQFARNAVRNRMPFDNDFKYNEGEGIYCTELVLRAWHEAGVDLLPDVKKGDSIMPARLKDSPRCRVKWTRRAR